MKFFYDQLFDSNLQLDRSISNHSLTAKSLCTDNVYSEPTHKKLLLKKAVESLMSTYS